MPIIEVNHVTKEFELGQFRSLKQAALNGIKRLAGKPIEENQPFKALDDVSFSVKEGEVLGIIGHNGAGKSTLLKLLANISKPSRGSVKVRGRVAPLIEVGAGLIGDLSGRENIYLNGTLLGMGREEISRKFDEIVAFAELEEFIDTPIKRYSSGMQVRLGFSIATAVPSEILIVDEVLAVGDLAFQRKCFDRMEDIIKRQGRTVLMVSHNIRQVERMSSRVILLNKGRVLLDNKPRTTCDRFYQISNQQIGEQAAQYQTSRVVSSGEAIDVCVEVVDGEARSINSIIEGTALRIVIRFTLRQHLTNPEFHVGTHTTDFVYLTGESSAVLQEERDYAPGIHQIEHIIPAYPLVPGTYGIRFALIDSRGRVVFNGEALRFFNIIPKEGVAPIQDELRLISTAVQWMLHSTQAEREPTTKAAHPM